MDEYKNGQLSNNEDIKKILTIEPNDDYMGVHSFHFSALSTFLYV